MEKIKGDEELPRRKITSAKIIEFVKNNEGCTIKDMVKHFKCHQESISQILRRLVEAGKLKVKTGGTHRGGRMPNRYYTNVCKG